MGSDCADLDCQPSLTKNWMFCLFLKNIILTLHVKNLWPVKIFIVKGEYLNAGTFIHIVFCLEDTASGPPIFGPLSLPSNLKHSAPNLPPYVPQFVKFQHLG